MTTRCPFACLCVLVCVCLPARLPPACCVSCQVFPRLRESVTDIRQKLACLEKSYWEKFDEKVCGVCSPHEVDSLSTRFLQAMRRWIDQGPRRRPEGMTYKDKALLFEAEAAARHQLDTKWARIDEEIGMLEVSSMYDFHFLIRGQQKPSPLDAWHQPAAGVRHVLLDYKQHVTLPVGPSEPCWSVSSFHAGVCAPDGHTPAG